MTATCPTIAATHANLNIPEITERIVKGMLKIDGKIIQKDGSIRVSKVALHYAWNIPGLAKRLGLSEPDFRECLHKYSQNNLLLEPDINVYLPPVGGMTVYVFGDPRALLQTTTEIAVRVHDE